MGRSKAWLPVGGEPMLVRVARVVGAAVEPVVVVAGPGKELPDLPAGVEVVRDAAEGNGPLQGLAAGLAALAERTDAAFTVGCDAPFLTAAFIQRLVSLRGDADACVCAPGDFPRPLPGVYAVGVLDRVDERLAAGLYSLRGLLERVTTRLAHPSELADIDPTLESLRNINTPDDYTRALADLAQMRHEHHDLPDVPRDD
ncbi:NTP transferase domain-containing protein [bacterium]|nr:NTP transferase domain-containing protein [bacterium]